MRHLSRLPALPLLAGLVVLALPTSALAYTQTLSATTTVAGQDHLLNFTGLPSGSGTVTLTIGLQGDFSYGNLSNPEGSQNYADGNFLGSFIPANVGSSGDCTGAVYTTTYTFPASYINDNNAVLIRIDLYAEVGTFCSQQGVSATISYSSNTPPTITAILDRAHDEDTAGSATFTVADAQDSAGSIGVAAVSSNTGIIATVGAANSAGAGTLTWTPVADAFGTTTITVTATDSGGATATESFIVTVNPVNDAPVADAGGPYLGFEGSAVALSGSGSSDVDDAIVSYRWDCDFDGNADVVVSSAAAGACTFDDEGTYIVGLQVDDASGARSPAALASVEVSNVAPSLSVNGPTVGVEGQTIPYSASATDPSAVDSAALSYSWLVTSSTGATVQTGSGPSLSFVPPDDDTYTVAATVTDPDGGSDTASILLSVANLSPSVSIAGPAAGDEGSALAWTLTGADPGSVDNGQLAFFWAITDAGGATLDSNIGSAPAWTPADDGSYTLNVTVNDPQGATGSASLALTIANVAPLIDSTAPTTAFEGQLYSYQPTVVDPGDEVFTWSPSPSAPTGMTVDSASGLVQWTPTYADALAGSFGIVLQVSDGDGGSDGEVFTVVVTAADDDGDGMADGWELSNGLDPTDPDDGALDPDADGMSNLIEFGWGTDPNVDDGPDAPTPVAPIGGVEVADVSPDLLWDNAYDPQGQALTYDVEVYGDAALTSWLTGASGLSADPSGQTTWKVDVALPENTLVWWRVVAADPFVAGPFSSAESFVVNAANEAPSAPTLVYPVGGELTGRTPTLLWSESVDADGDAMQYCVEVYDATGALVTSAIEIVGDGVTASWDVDITLVEDAPYSWTAWAMDEHGLAGLEAPAEEFFASDDDGAPTQTVFVSPQDGAAITALSPDLTATASTDPEGGAVEYLFEVDVVAAFDTFQHQSATVADPQWSLADDGVVLPENTWVFARVRAIDGAGVSSVPDTISFLVRGANDAPSVPVLVSPGDGEEGGGSPIFVVADPVDPEGDVVLVDFVVAADEAMTELLGGVEGVLVGGEGTTSWLADLALSGPVYWSARAVDDHGAESEWATPWRYVAPTEAVPPGDDDDDDGEGCAQCQSSVAGGPGSAFVLAAFGLPWLLRRRRG